MKIGAKIRPDKMEWVLKMASKNSEAIRNKGSQEMNLYCSVEEEIPIREEGDGDAEDGSRVRFRTVRTLNEEKFRDAQTKIHTMLVLACVDSCYKIIAGVDESEVDCGTQIWDKLLRRF